MAFEYLWDRKDNVLVVRFPADFARRGMVGLMVSVEDGGRSAPSLSVPLSPGRLDNENDVFLLAPLPPADAGRRLYVTVEPVCVADSEEPVPAERLVLAVEEPPPDASPSYWILDRSGPSPMLVIDPFAPEALSEEQSVARSHRLGDTIYPAMPGYLRAEASAVRLFLELQETDGTLHHLLRFEGPADRRDSGTVEMSLVGAADACKALLSGDSRSLHPHPAGSLAIGRGGGEPARFLVRADAPPLAGEPFDEGAPALQFLDRLVLAMHPASAVEIFRDGRRIAESRSPLLLADMGGGQLEPDEGALKALARSVMSGADEDPGNARAETLTPFAEAVRWRTQDRIMRALPSAAELRPVDIASLRDNASFYQALAWLELPIEPRQHGPLRQALRNRNGETAALRSLCKAAMTMFLARETRRQLVALDKERLEAWLRGHPDAAESGELTALHHCLAVLAWEHAGWTLAHGVRPDPTNLSAPVDEDSPVPHAERLERFRRLYEMGLLDRSRGDLVVFAHELADASSRLAADWSHAGELIRSVQAEIGIHPQVELHDVSANAAPGQPVDTPLLAALEEALRPRLKARGQDVTAAGGLARALALRLAPALAADYRVTAAFAAQHRLAMPRFFETAAAGQGAPLYLAAVDPQELRDWIAPRVSDMPLVRSWKEDLRRQGEAHGEQARRQT